MKGKKADDMLVGTITTKHIISHPVILIGAIGLQSYVRLVFDSLGPKKYTFLDVLFNKPALENRAAKRSKGRISSYVAGVILVLATVLVIATGKFALSAGSEAKAENSGTAFGIHCVGVSKLMLPKRVMVVFAFAPDGSQILASVEAVGARGGGSSNLAVADGLSSMQPGWGYVVFDSPKMEHIHSCKGYGTHGTLQWRYAKPADNIYIGSGSKGQASESGFQEVGRNYTSIISEKPFLQDKPVVSYDYGDARFIMKRDMSSEQTGDFDFMDIDFQSVIM